MNTPSHKSGLRPAVVVLSLLVFSTLIAGASLKSGDEFPKLDGYKLEGKLPDSLAGKVVLVDFWASWCVPCAASFPMMEELHQSYHDKGLVILGVSVDEKEGKMSAFLKKHPVSFAVVRDVDHKLADVADVQTMPTSFLIDRNGKVRFLHDGFHGEKTKKQYVEEIEALLKEAK